MLHIAANGFITMNRGDSFKVPLFINEGTELSPARFSFKDYPNSTLYFALMEPNQIFENAIVRKVYNSESELTPEGDVLITFVPKDTEYLHPGKYYYQIKLVKFNGEVITIIPKTEFYLC